ncbi:metallophosphoesterase [Metabacillus sp. KIGAM252]|uniref:Metallophosphoesterase n=1 Tax=Metabacillus flavus TaxID=2823519 RepID=A0ABS5LIN8_9BACI|nr:metallophosphoesterase [Metabacillus flavus]MBS2970582.1 metallophosphoesterase [Metabacillus flavus]
MKYIRILLILLVIFVLTALPYKGHAGEDFSFVWMTDTQYYVRDHPKILTSQMNWIVKNRMPERLSYLVHTGDLVHNSGQYSQWERNHQAFRRLDAQGFSYGVLPGNHDFTGSGGLQPYYRFFGEHRFDAKPYYKGSFLDNCGHYDLAGGKVFLYMGWCKAGKGEVKWMNRVLKHYRNKEAVMAFHDYLTYQGTRSKNGDRIYKDVVVPNKNVKLVLSGHYYGIAKRVDVPQKGRKVYQLLANYQGLPQGGGGYMQILTWKQGGIRVRSYSPYLDKEWAKPYFLKMD